jgi:hypothetical protein
VNGSEKFITGIAIGSSSKPSELQTFLHVEDCTYLRVGNDPHLQCRLYVLVFFVGIKHHTHCSQPFWVFRGLLVSGMSDTATGVVENLMELVERYGFVPNGARVYYENRRY